MRKRVDRTRNLAYLGVVHHASLVAAGEPHYLARESLVNYTRMNGKGNNERNPTSRTRLTISSPLFLVCPVLHRERDHILMRLDLTVQQDDKRE